MTLTELKYIVALAQERHFGRAAQRSFVTQPTLSLALAKLEDELGVKLFERNKNEVLVTARGQAIVEQARRADLAGENLLVLNNGHCFRDQVLEACPGQSNTALPEGRAGSSLETIRNMVASGLGVSVLPSSALVPRYASKLLKVVAFTSPVPSRKVALAWRTSFDRPVAIETLAEAIRSVKVPCLKMA